MNTETETTSIRLQKLKLPHLLICLFIYNAPQKLSSDRLRATI